MQILQLIADGFEDPQISAMLGLSRDTVKTHVARVRAKLGAATRSAAACELVRRGWID